VKFQPGSIGWLMRHEWRLYRRGLNAFGGNGVIIFVLVALHLLAILAALGLRHLPALPQHTAAVALTFGGVFVLLLMISRGLVTAVQALYARGDMDLMLSSPIAPRSIITVRASIIAAAVTLEFGILIWPFADVFVLFGRFEWLKAYVLLPALGALATSISLLLALIAVGRGFAGAGRGRPDTAGEVVRVKLEAALLPILPLVLLPVLVLWRSHGWFGFSVSVCAAGAALCCAALNVRDRTPGNRRDFRTRYKGRPGRGFVELAVVGVWAGVCALMVWASPRR
jgi:hypothetical protein